MGWCCASVDGDGPACGPTTAPWVLVQCVALAARSPRAERHPQGGGEEVRAPGTGEQTEETVGAEPMRGPRSGEPGASPMSGRASLTVARRLPLPRRDHRGPQGLGVEAGRNRWSATPRAPVLGEQLRRSASTPARLSRAARPLLSGPITWTRPLSGQAGPSASASLTTTSALPVRRRINRRGPRFAVSAARQRRRSTRAEYHWRRHENGRAPFRGAPARLSNPKNNCRTPGKSRAC